MDRRIKAAIQIMLDNRIPQVQISDLAQSVNLSHAYFTKLFKEEMGLKPKECARYWRLQQAKNLLDHTFLKVNEVASAVGFRHVPSFTRAFRQFYGHAPSASRADRSLKITLPAGRKRGKFEQLN